MPRQQPSLANLLTNGETNMITRTAILTAVVALSSASAYAGGIADQHHEAQQDIAVNAEYSGNYKGIQGERFYIGEQEIIEAYQHNSSSDKQQIARGQKGERLSHSNDS